MEAGKCLIIVWLKRCPRVSYHQRSSGENSLWEGGMTDHLSSFLSMIIFACAPAWGATPYEYFQVYPVFISTHAPAWGATDVSSLKADSIIFLLTPPRGGRPFTILSSMVSGLFLLTPPRGGRQGRYCRVGNRPYFYSRPRVGGDEQMAETQLDNLQDFYSRPRVGGDTVIGDVAEVQLVISTHAPAWGATTAKVLHQQPKIISTHAPAWGATAIFHKGQTGM